MTGMPDDMGPFEIAGWINAEANQLREASGKTDLDDASIESAADTLESAAEEFRSLGRRLD
jgi:hypothetical protein